MGSSKYHNTQRYSTLVADNMSLKEARLFEKQLEKQLKLNLEEDILLSITPIRTITELICKYSNEEHIVYYYEKTHSLLIKGTMYVAVFHSLLQDAEKFKFTDIILRP